MRRVPGNAAWRRRAARFFFVALLAGQLLGLNGCALCTKHLYLYRDTPEKSLPTENLALLITDPNLANAVLATPAGYAGSGCQWALEQPVHETDAYRLSIETLDGKAVYQGLCMDTTPTYAVEVRPGTRQVRLRLEMFGPWGQEKAREVATLTLEPGKCYFLWPDCEAMKSRRFLLKVDRLPEPYNASLRSRLIAWKSKTMKGMAD